MHQLTAFSLKNRALIALVTIVAAVFGLIGVGSLKQELMPSVQFPAIAVVTTYPGASPEVVNKDVSGPIETALRGVPDLESTTATSSTGASMVVAQFTYGVDIAATEQKAERAISRISQMLPEGIDTQVLSGSIDDFPVIQIAVTPADGETPEDTAQLIDRIVTPELSDIDGVRDAQLSGAREERVTIDPSGTALRNAGITVQTLTDTLQQSGVLLAGGTITDGDRTLAVQTGSALTTAEEIADLPIARSAAEIVARQQALAQTEQQPGQLPDQMQPGQLPAQDPAAGGPETENNPLIESPILTIGDVADVRLEPGPEESISRVDGAPALTIAVTKMSAANTVEVSHAVQQKLDELQDQLGGAKMKIIFDQAPYIEESVHTLTTEGLLGLVFAVLVILVFLLSVRATLVTAISIPVSVLLTFVGLNFAEYTLNMLTLGALTISIGRVVDDSIVVIENIKRHLALDPAGSAPATIVGAVREVAGAITASTITTVAVFLPMAFVNGMVGELFRPFAFTVTIALAASLLVALTIVPVLAYWFLRKRTEPRAATVPGAGEAASGATAGHEEERGISRLLARWYRPVIEWTLEKPVATLLLALLVLGATLAATPLMKTNFMGSDEQNSVGLLQELEPGTSLEAQLKQAERVEKALADVDAVQTVQVTIGSAGGGMAAIFGGGGDGTVNYSITTDPDANQAKVQDRIRKTVDALKKAGDFSIGQSGGGVTSSNAIEVSVTAPDQQTLAEASKAVQAELEKQDGLEQVESDLSRSRPFLRVDVDRQQAAEVGLTEAAVAGQVAAKMQPKQVGQITMDADTVAVYVAQGEAPADEAGVGSLSIQTAAGDRALSTLAEITVADGPVTVSTENGVRMVTVSALPKGDDLGSAGIAVNQALESVDLPAGANASIGGVMSQQSESFQQLGLALLVAILIVYVVMVATFRSLLQPLLLLISVPFSATGALLLLIATGIPLGVASLIGVLMLVGIVVTNAIVLIDLVNQYRDRGDSIRDAVLHGAMQRLRPIVMTALATILALTPMGLGITGKGGFISQPLAIVVIGGLLSSTVLTLIVLPTLYYLVERRRDTGAGPRRRGGTMPLTDAPSAAGAAALAAGTAGALFGAETRAGDAAAPAAGTAIVAPVSAVPTGRSGREVDVHAGEGAAVAELGASEQAEGVRTSSDDSDTARPTYDLSVPIEPPVFDDEPSAGVEASGGDSNEDVAGDPAQAEERSRPGAARRLAMLRAMVDREFTDPETTGSPAEHLSEAAHSAEPGLETQQMSLALSNLGFTREETMANPIIAPEAEAAENTEDAEESPDAPALAWDDFMQQAVNGVHLDEPDGAEDAADSSAEPPEAGAEDRGEKK